MIGKIFLGKAWHWALIAIAAGLLWFCGSQRLHVIEFNIFVGAMLLGTALAVFAVVWCHHPGEQVTRDRLVADTADGETDAVPIRD